MNYNRVAFRYAKALLLSCKGDNDKLEAVHNDMSFINNTFDESEELKPVSYTHLTLPTIVSV